MDKFMQMIIRKANLGWFLLFSLALTLYVLFARPESHNLQRSKKQLAQDEQRLDKLRSENKLLKLSLEQGKNELIYEIMARQRGMQMPNERVYVFQEPKQK